MSVTIKDHSDDFERAWKEQLEAALEAVGNQAASYAKNNVKAAGRKDTGALQNGITHVTEMSEKAAYIGTNTEYAPYHELGTGLFAEGGPGRQGWWVYVPGSGGGGGGNSGKVYTYERAAQIVAILQSQGIDAHMTQGIRPIHFLKNAASDHADEYRKIIKKYLEK